MTVLVTAAGGAGAASAGIPGQEGAAGKRQPGAPSPHARPRPRIRIEAAKSPAGRYRMPGYSIRESSVVAVNGSWAAYADAVSWKSPYHPNTYSTAIHEFEPADDGSWPHHGEVVRGGPPGAWDHGGVATPGAVCRQGKFLLFYSGREKADGSGHRYIGLAVAGNPRGAFVKLPQPVTAGPGHRDDPCPVLAADGRRILLYYRLAVGGRYAIRLASAPAPEGPWREEGEVVPAAGTVRAVETTDAKRIGDWIVLAVMEHDRRRGKGIRTGLYLSRDGRSFVRAEPPAFEDLAPALVKGGGMATHLSLHVDDTGVVRSLGMTRVTGPRDAYTRFVYPVRAFRLGPAPEGEPRP